MANRRAKIAAATTVLSLGALGGVALGTNHGVPAAGQQVAGGSGSAALVTSASGATLNQPVAVRSAGSSTRPPIVTRASGAGGLTGSEFDD
ncbi:MAG: hypothetical protein WBM00_01575 [Solirubrobacterales bacterium]